MVGGWQPSGTQTLLPWALTATLESAGDLYGMHIGSRVALHPM